MNFSVNDTHFFSEIILENQIQIKSSKKTYDVFYNHKTLKELVIENYKKGDFIFIDKNVYELHKDVFENIEIIRVFDAIEENKNIENVLMLLDNLFEFNFNRKNKLIVIGGGITQDVGGFASAIYKRGIHWIFIPTTFLSMTDSCIGSKVSINRKSKNMLGMFVCPEKILISDTFFHTLSEKDIISGIGEALKLCLIGGKESYDYFKEQYSRRNYINLIKVSALIKKQIIEYDEFDENERRVLNYGHTVGHAIESTTQYFIPHGIAVLIGMYIENILFQKDNHTEINEWILGMIDPIFFKIEINYELFIKHLLSDKKNNGDCICFILLEEVGKTKIVFENIENIYESLKNIIIGLFRI